MPKQDEQQQQHDLRSYDPYLISYHEDTHSFTYNDPWVEVTHEDINNSHFNDNVVEHHQDFTSTPSLPATTTSSNTNESNNLEISTSSSTHHEEDSNYNNCSDKLITQNHQPPPPAVIEKVVEHKTEEVSCLSLSLPPSSFRVQKWHEIECPFKFLKQFHFMSLDFSSSDFLFHLSLNKINIFFFLFFNVFFSPVCTYSSWSYQIEHKVVVNRVDSNNNINNCNSKIVMVNGYHETPSHVEVSVFSLLLSSTPCCLLEIRG